MKKLVLSLLAVGAMGLYSCVDDPCKDVDCVNGTCDGVTGACICDDGYETDADGICNTLVVTKFLGQWNTTEDCSQSAPFSYNITITAGTAVNTIRISNFWGLFVNSVNATVSGNTVTIPSQEPDSDGYTVSGTGTISGTTLTLTYTVVDPANVADVCTGTVFSKL